MNTILGLLLIGMGIWMIVAPKSAFEFKVKMVKRFGGNLTGGKKIIGAYRWIGVLVLALGLILL